MAFDLLTQSETARVLSCTPASVAYRAKRRMGLTPVRRGRHVLFAKSEVIKLAGTWRATPHPKPVVPVEELLKVGA